MLTHDSEFYYWEKGLHTPFNNFFSTKEFTCTCTSFNCGQQRIAINLIDKLTYARNELGAPISVHSGYRCAYKQAELKAQGYETATGVSQHELGRAADVSATSMHDLLTLLHVSFLAIGVANTFIHVDLRADKPRLWSYLSM